MDENQNPKGLAALGSEILRAFTAVDGFGAPAEVRVELFESCVSGFARRKARETFEAYLAGEFGPSEATAVYQRVKIAVVEDMIKVFPNQDDVTALLYIVELSWLIENSMAEEVRLLVLRSPEGGNA